MQRYNKKKFIIAFCIIVAVLAIIRHAFSIQTTIPEEKETIEIAEAQVEHPNSGNTDIMVDSADVSEADIEEMDTEETDIEEADIEEASIEESETKVNVEVSEHQLLEKLGVCDSDSARLYLPEIYSPQKHVHSYSACFPDINPVQLRAAIAVGIPPVSTREEAQEYLDSHRLVNITNSPYYVVDPLTHSIPYLVPKCQELLNTICINFIDSLRSNGLPPHLPIVTSVLRTSKDIKKLQKGNVNSTTNSCHCYGTTVDITYNRFYPISGNHKESQKKVARYNAQMKKILAEVLLDLRMEGRCYVKHEVKQACFHLTVRP